MVIISSGSFIVKIRVGQVLELGQGERKKLKISYIKKRSFLLREELGELCSRGK
jgi:hypothetical protein